MSNILLIEDDIEINEMLTNYLKKQNHDIESAFDGVEGISKFMIKKYDLAIIDIMLPKLGGLEIVKIIREKSKIPILIISAKDKDVDKAQGLDLGADDYISKPFSMIEFTSRINALFRRTKLNTDENLKKKELELVHGDIKLNILDYSVVKKGRNVFLTSKEYEILKLFISNKKMVFTKAKIYEMIWNNKYYGDENVINVHMRRLREKIEDNPSKPKYILTLWGIGYKLGDG
jgi:DNA-binding response OmpR family regulator